MLVVNQEYWKKAKCLEMAYGTPLWQLKKNSSILGSGTYIWKIVSYKQMFVKDTTIYECISKWVFVVVKFCVLS